MLLFLLKPEIGSLKSVRKILLSVLLFSAFLIPVVVYAACSGPAGIPGDYMYNKDFHVEQFCDGTTWNAMGPMPGTGGSGCTGYSNSGLVGYWKLDESTGTDAIDSSGNGNTGTLTNSPTWATGIYNGALTLNGTNQVFRRAS